MPGDAEGSSIEPCTSKRVTRFSRWELGAQLGRREQRCSRYMFAHEAHHRGQAIMLAHQLGYKLPDKATYGI